MIQSHCEQVSKVILVYLESQQFFGELLEKITTKKHSLLTESMSNSRRVKS